MTLKRWKDNFVQGTKERSAFDDMEAFVRDQVKSSVISIGPMVPDIAETYTHSLGRIPESYILTQANAPAIIYATEEDLIGWTDKQIVIRSNTAVVGKLLLY